MQKGPEVLSECSSFIGLVRPTQRLKDDSPTLSWMRSASRQRKMHLWKRVVRESWRHLPCAQGQGGGRGHGGPLERVPSCSFVAARRVECGLSRNGSRAEGHGPGCVLKEWKQWSCGAPFGTCRCTRCTRAYSLRTSLQPCKSFSPRSGERLTMEGETHRAQPSLHRSSCSWILSPGRS